MRPDAGEGPPEGPGNDHRDRRLHPTMLDSRGLNLATRGEAGALQRSLMHRLTILKDLWHAEPVGLASLGDWIADVADEMRGKLREMKMFTVRKTTTLTEHDAGVQTIIDSAGAGFVLQDGETTTNTDTGLDTNTMEGRETYTP